MEGKFVQECPPTSHPYFIKDLDEMIFWNYISYCMVDSLSDKAADLSVFQCGVWINDYFLDMSVAAQKLGEFPS
jgi:hypothetical protein